MSWADKFVRSLIPTGLDKAGGNVKKIVDSVTSGSAPKEMTDALLTTAGKGLLNLGKRAVGARTVEQRERNNPAINAILENIYGFAQGGIRTVDQSASSLSTNFLIQPFDNPALMPQYNANIAQVAVFNTQIETFMSTGNVVAANPIISQRNNLISYFNGRMLNLKQIIVDRNTFNELSRLLQNKNVTQAGLSSALPANVLQMLRNVCVENRGFTGRVSQTFLEIPNK